MRSQRATLAVLVVLIVAGFIVATWLLRDDPVPANITTSAGDDDLPVVQSSRPEVDVDATQADDPENQPQPGERTHPTRETKAEETTPPTELASGALAGYVVDISLQPVSGVTVIAMGASPELRPETLTDPHGRYQFSDLPAGSWRLMVVETEQHTYQSGPPAIDVVGGETNEVGADFVLCPLVSVTIHLLDQDRQKLEPKGAGGRDLFVTAVFSSPGDRTTRLRGNVGTDSVVTFDGVPVDAFDVVLNTVGFKASAPLYLRLSEGQSNNAGEVVLKRIGDDAEQEVSTGSAVGVVTDEDGKPIAGIDVFPNRASEKDEFGHNYRVDLRATTDDHGRFEFKKLTAGEWYFIITNAEYRVVKDPGAVTIESGKQTKAPDFVLAKPSE